MKAVLEFLKDFTTIPITAIGWVCISLFACTMIPSLNFIPKGILLYILTPFVFGH